jgi:hypothetical protein
MERIDLHRPQPAGRHRDDRPVLLPWNITGLFGVDEEKIGTVVHDPMASKLSQSPRDRTRA